MRRTWAIAGTTIFLFVAPGVVAGLVPWWITGWHVHAEFGSAAWLRTLGLGLAIFGIPMVLDSFARFALQGLGTPAPIYPTEHLVVSGLYRHVRNPMYLGVAAVIFGQALWFLSGRLFAYGLCVWLAFHIFVLCYEEPKLERGFGEEYREWKQHVPRWVPRLRAWKGK
jgi:protein-S-isoprenylcysteine O-methyltransferase Ste14